MADDTDAKVRVTLYMDPSLAERLWAEKAKTRRNVSAIGSEILRDHFGRLDAPPPRGPARRRAAGVAS